MTSRAIAFAAAVLAGAALVVPVRADARGHHPHDITKVFSDVEVGPRDVVDGDVNVVFGNATIEGTVHGDVNTFFGSCTTAPGAVIDGDRNCVAADGLRAAVPWIMPHPFVQGPLGVQDRALFEKLASSAVVIVIFLLFPVRMRIALDRVERHPALSAGAGVLAAVAALPLGVLLIITLLGIPLAILEFFAILVGVWIGTGAIALLVGRRLCELIMPASTPSPFVALVLGLVVVSAAEIVPFLGWAVTALVWLVGLGCAILAFIRTSTLDPMVRRVPISRSAAPPR